MLRRMQWKDSGAEAARRVARMLGRLRRQQSAHTYKVTVIDVRPDRRTVRREAREPGVAD